MRRTLAIVLFTFVTTCASAAYGQQDDEAVRNRTREQLAQLLEKAGPTINVAFSQSQKQPYNYVGTLRTGLVNAESLKSSSALLQNRLSASASTRITKARTSMLTRSAIAPH